MTQSDSSTTGVQRVAPRCYIYDRRLPDDRTDFHARCGACYAWDAEHGYDVLGEAVAWGVPATEERPERLVDIVQSCLRDGAVLLVHDTTMLWPWVVRSLRDGAGVVTVLDGPVWLDGDGQLIGLAGGRPGPGRDRERGAR
jgi:hypothetical protein